VAGSTSRKLVQPFVRQYGRVVACVRRRWRRIELERPARDVVVVRVSILVVRFFLRSVAVWAACAACDSLTTAGFGAGAMWCPGGVTGARTSLETVAVASD
jgi:hypothetical protein